MLKINYKKDYLIAAVDNEIIINLPFNEKIDSFLDIGFDKDSIFLKGKKSNDLILAEIPEQGRIIGYLKTKKTFIINIFNNNTDLIINQFKITKK